MGDPTRNIKIPDGIACRRGTMRQDALYHDKVPAIGENLEHIALMKIAFQV